MSHRSRVRANDFQRSGPAQDLVKLEIPGINLGITSASGLRPASTEGLESSPEVALYCLNAHSLAGRAKKRIGFFLESNQDQLRLLFAWTNPELNRGPHPDS